MKKPIIFFEPIYEKLQNLKAIYEEENNDPEFESEIEVFSVSDDLEALQILETLAPALWITSSPKKCIIFAAKNKKKFKKTKSKMALLSATALPAKASKKIQQLAINLLLEPIVPKTLKYKLNLLVRSLPQRKSSEDENIQTLEKNEEAPKKAKEMRLEKLMADDDLVGQLENQITNDDSQEVDLLDTQAATSSSLSFNFDSDPSEDSKDLNLVDLDDDSSKNGFDDVQIDIYDSGSKKKKLDVEEETLEDLYSFEKKKKSTFDLDEDPLDKKRSDLLIDDLEDESKKNIDLDLIESFDDNQKNIDLLFDEHLDEKDKKNASSPLLEDEEQSKKNSLDLIFDDDLDSTKEKKQLTLEEEDEKNKERIDLDLIDDESLDKKKTSLDFLEEDDEKKKKLDELDIFEDETEKKKTDLDIEEIEEDLDLTKDLESLEDEQAKNKKGGELDFDLDEEQEDLRSLEDLGDEDEKNKEKIDLLFDEDLEEEKASDLDEIEEDPYQKKKKDLILEDHDLGDEKDKALDLLEEDLSQKNDRDLKVDDDESDLYGKDINLVVDDDLDDSDAQKKKKKEIELDLKKKTNLEVLDDFEGKKKTHLDVEDVDLSEEKKDPLPEDWDIMDKNNILQAEGWNKEQIDAVINQMEKNNWQDRNENYQDFYQKLKDKAQPYDEEKEKKHDDFLFSQLSEEKKKGKKQESKEEAKEEKTPLPEEENLYDKDKIFKPDTRGLEFSIKLVPYLRNPEKKQQDFFEFIANHLYKELGGRSRFLKFSDGSFQDLYIADLSLEGLAQTSNSWAETKSANSSTWKEVNVPNWSDETWQAEEQVFLFPYFEGVNLLGMGHVEIPKKVNEQDARFVEVLMENARTIYLEDFNDLSISSKGQKEKKESKPQINFVDKIANTTSSLFKKTKGFFKGLFS